MRIPEKLPKQSKKISVTLPHARRAMHERFMRKAQSSQPPDSAFPAHKILRPLFPARRL